MARAAQGSPTRSALTISASDFLRSFSGDRTRRSERSDRFCGGDIFSDLSVQKIPLRWVNVSTFVSQVPRSRRNGPRNLEPRDLDHFTRAAELSRTALSCGAACADSPGHRSSLVTRDSTASLPLNHFADEAEPTFQEESLSNRRCILDTEWPGEQQRFPIFVAKRDRHFRCRNLQRPAEQSARMQGTGLRRGQRTRWAGRRWLSSSTARSRRCYCRKMAST